ncbi:LMBR1 domain-containing protein 2 [Chytriomyces hyalinus]|nr:LMBR1 domain-containing protein 2 [Chytriomyces hyalinus]KAJ3235380.1 LMBR1 domain-containing protein 2 [Chytriomyces hyalinus]
MLLTLALLALLGVFVGFLLSYFGDVRRAGLHTQLVSFVAWFFPFAIVLVLPLDLASTLHRRCLESLNSHAALANLTTSLEIVNGTIATLGEAVVLETFDADLCEEPLFYLSREFLVVFWGAVYWTMQLLTWFIVPVMLSFVRSGDFAFWPKLKGALKENVIMYAIMGVAGVAFLVYMIVAVKFTTESLTAILMAAANAWGLLLCTCMLGYGLVEIPRDLWATASPARRLRALEIAAPRSKEKMIDSEAEVYEVARELATLNHKVPDTDPLRVHVDLLLSKCPLAMDEKVRGDVDRRGRAKEVTLDDLKALHARIKYSITLSERHQAQYRFLLEKAWFLTDVVDNANNPDWMFKSVFVKPWNSEVDMVRFRALWLWYLWIRPALIYLFSVVFILASVALIWSESTFGIKSVPLSIPALLLKNNYISYASLEFISISFLIYMCTCAYSTLFKIKIFDYYVIVPEHCTDEPSLLFVGAYLCRLTFPLCYNFLNMVSDDENSVFVEYQGKAIDLAPLLGDSFNTWVPLLVLVVSTITYLNLFGRISALFGGKSFMTGHEGRDADAIEGRGIISQARSHEERRSGGAFATAGADRLRNTNRIPNTAEFLARYGKGPGVSIQPAASTGRGSPSTSTAGNVANIVKSSSVTKPANPTTSGASAASGSASTVGTSQAAAGNKGGGGGVFARFGLGFSGGAGKYQKLDGAEGDDRDAGGSGVGAVVAEPSGSFSFKMMNIGGASNSTAQSGKEETGAAKSGRVFGTAAGASGGTTSASPAASRSKPAPLLPPPPPPGPSKKRNMFDDI